MEHLSAAMALAHTQRHVPSVTASTALSKRTSVTTATATRKTLAMPLSSGQNWRGKYLRALNISTPEVDVTRKRAAVVSSASAAAPSQAQLIGRRGRSSHSHSRQVPLAPRPSRTATEYGFAGKPELARGRRCHTDPAVQNDSDRLSAPIQIPTARASSATTFGAKLSDVTNVDQPIRRADNAGNDNQQERLHTWATPVARKTSEVATHGAVGGLDMAFSQLQVRGRVVGNDSFSKRRTEVVDTTEDDGRDGSDSDTGDDDDIHDPIFEMEEDFESSNRHDNDSDTSSPNLSRSRRQRTATANTSETVSSRVSALSRFPSVRPVANTASELSVSFVPPHKLVQRDVFSLGFRDKFKRRPAKI